MTQTGYFSEAYAKTFENLGTVKWLNSPLSGAVLERNILSTGYKDLCSLYPVFASDTLIHPLNLKNKINKATIANEFKRLKEDGVVSLTLISDPLNNFIKDCSIWNGLSACQQDLGFDEIQPYKLHYIVRLQEKLEYSTNHLRNIKKANLTNRIRIHTDPLVHTSLFYKAYCNLIKRHDILGFPNFDVDQIRNQLDVPGTILFSAETDTDFLGYMLFYLEWPNVRYHLGCYFDEGYAYNASFSLMNAAINFFSNMGCEFLVLGAGSGVVSSSEGLERFKSGWTKYTKQNFIMKKVINKEVYDLLSKDKDTKYFPAYRAT